MPVRPSQKDESGSAAPREDFLEEDAEIPGQKFTLVSFLSPEKVLANKDVFLFTKFVKEYEIQYKTKNIEQFLFETIKGINDKLETAALECDVKDLSGVAQAYRSGKLRIEEIVERLDQYTRKNLKEIQTTKIQDDYESSLLKNRVKWEDEFFTLNDFHTTVRGFKVRGSFSSLPEAQGRAKKLQRNDPTHDIYVAETGKWTPWHPDVNQIADQEYAEEELNTLMKKHNENDELSQEYGKARREEAKKGKKTHASVTDLAPPVEARPAARPAAQPARITEGADAVPAPTPAPTQYDGIFEGPADLVIERKAAAAKQAEEDRKTE